MKKTLSDILSDGEICTKRDKINIIKSKPRPMKQFINKNQITEILKYRYKENYTIKEASEKYNLSITLIKKIINKYGKDYVQINKLYDELPKSEDLIKYWSEGAIKQTIINNLNK